VKLHPVTELLPPLAPDELDALRESIRAHGVLEPALIDEDGRIVEGRHRAELAAELGIDLPTAPLPDGVSSLDAALGTNLARRNLTQAQRAIVAAEAWPDLGKAKRGGNHSKGSQEPLTGEGLAARFGIARQSVTKASALVERDPDAAAAVKRGSLPLADAYEALRKREREHQSRDQQVRRLREEHPELAERVDAETLTLEEARTLGLERAREEAEARTRLRSYMKNALAHLVWDGDLDERVTYIVERITDDDELSADRWRSAAAVTTAIAEQLERGDE